MVVECQNRSLMKISAQQHRKTNLLPHSCPFKSTIISNTAGSPEQDMAIVTNIEEFLN